MSTNVPGTAGKAERNAEAVYHSVPGSQICWWGRHSKGVLASDPSFRNVSFLSLAADA